MKIKYILTSILVFLSFLSKSQSITDSIVNSFIEDWKNVPYRYGGTTKKGIDCSAFSQKFYQIVFNLKIPRTCFYQQLYSIIVPIDSIRLGDIIFFNSSTSPSKRHCGVYLGDGNFIHASNYKYGIKINCLFDDYYYNRIISIGRYLKSCPD